MTHEFITPSNHKDFRAKNYLENMAREWMVLLHSSVGRCRSNKATYPCTRAFIYCSMWAGKNFAWSRS